MATHEDRIDVLLVEDSPSDARLLCELLQDYPPQRFAVEQVERLEEAVGLLAAKTFDVVLLDLTLPDSAGLETCTRMRRAAPHLPIVVLTGVDDETLALEAIRQGVNDYLVKGQIIQGSMIGRTVRYAVERSRAERALREAHARLQLQTEEVQTANEELRAQTEELQASNEALRERELALRASEDRLRRSQEIAHLGSWELDLIENRLTWSDEVYRIFGLAPQQFAATYEAFLAHVHPDDRAAVDAAYGGSLRENRDVYEIEHRVIRSSTGEIRLVHEKCAHFRDASGRIIRSIGMVHDITERKQMEADLRRLNNELEKEVQVRTEELRNTVDRLRTAFEELEQRARQLQKLTLELSQAEDRERKRLAQILHDDLQQQLAAAKFHLSLLGHRARKNEAFREAMAQLDEILKDAIEKSRSLSHELSPAVLYHSDLGETFEWLARQLKVKHGLTVHVESRGHIDSASEPLKVFLFRTAQEILFNVVKHARVREARLRLQRMRGSLWLTISDQGRGFDPCTLGKAEGFGLLSIRERIELLGGRMRIRSAPGQGSTLLLTVPDDPQPKDGRQMAAEVGPRACPTPVTPGSPGGLPLRVLLVDDHEVMREGLATLLNEQGDLEVVGQAGNGREAVDLAGRLHPDVVVMDAAMPVMPGDEAIRQIKSRWPDVRIVALSMFEEADMSAAMQQAGAERYLLKTAPSDELLAAVRGRSSATSHGHVHKRGAASGSG